jgi:hypothetical protein
MILRELFQRTGNEFRKTEGGFCSEQVDLQKPPPDCTQISQSGRIKEITGPYFSKFWEAKSQRTDGKN